jgi:hypothetical protein
MAGNERLELQNGQLATQKVVDSEKTIELLKLATRKVANPLSIVVVHSNN